MKRNGLVRGRSVWMLLAVFTLLGSLMMGCAPEGPAVTVEDAWSRPSSSKVGVAGAFMTLKNSGREADQLIAARSDVARMVELHETVIENEVMKMQQVPEIVVPARGEVVLKPGSFHIMLMGLNRDLNEGERIWLALEFASGTEIEVEAEVRMQ